MHFTLKLHIDAQAVRVLRRMVRVVCHDAGFDDSEAAAIEVALGEALANAFLHAYEGIPGPVEVEAKIEIGFIGLTVRDEGRPLPEALRIPANIRAWPANRGRGLYLISRLMDEMEVNHSTQDARGTVVQMAKRSRSRPGLTERATTSSATGSRPRQLPDRPSE